MGDGDCFNASLYSVIWVGVVEGDTVNGGYKIADRHGLDLYITVGRREVEKWRSEGERT